MNGNTAKKIELQSENTVITNEKYYVGIEPFWDSNWSRSTLFTN